MKNETLVTEERLAELRAVLSRIDPEKRRPWILELLGPDGKPVMSFNIKSGQPVSNRRLAKQERRQESKPAGNRRPAKNGE